jgi:hypothetical protein
VQARRVEPTASRPLLGERAQPPELPSWNLDALRRSLEELGQRQDRLVRTLESQDDPTGAVFARARERMGELEADRPSKLQVLAALEAAEVDQMPPVWLLDELPRGERR